MLSALLALLAGPTLAVSIAKVEITPPEALPLGGYTERGNHVFEPGGEPLWARAVAFTAGRERIVVMACDMLTTPASLAREVRKRLPEGVRLFLTATHTHCAPDSQMLNDRMTFQVPGIATFKRRWLDWYSEKVAGAALAALGARTGNQAEIVVRERRVDANRPRRAGGEPDTMLTLVGPPTGEAWLADYAAHPVIYGQEHRRTSGDWPSRALPILNAFALIPGAIGDVSPRADGAGEEERMADFLDRFRSIAEPIPHRVWGPGDPVRWVEEPLELEPAKPHPTFAEAYGIPEVFAQTVVKQFAPVEAAISAFRLGKLAVVGVPGEPTGAIGRRIRDAGRRMGFSCVLVVSHVNGWIGYVLEPEDYDRGGYEATLSFNGRQTGELVVEASLKALSALRS